MEKNLRLVIAVARFAAASMLVVALIKFLMTFSFAAALAIGVSTFALMCLIRRDFSAPGAKIETPAPPSEPAAGGGWLGGLKRMLKFEDRDNP